MAETPIEEAIILVEKLLSEDHKLEDSSQISGMDILNDENPLSNLERELKNMEENSGPKRSEMGKK